MLNGHIHHEQELLIFLMLIFYELRNHFAVKWFNMSINRDFMIQIQW